MAILNAIMREIPPTHPGAVLREDFMPDHGLTTASLANALGVSRQTVNEIPRIHCKEQTKKRNGYYLRCQ
ncbi:MAG: hypothetical protein WCE56_00340, partial [Desulfobacterales bacterium]